MLHKNNILTIVECEQMLCNMNFVHCKNLTVILTNTYGYLSCMFVFSTPGSEYVI